VKYPRSLYQPRVSSRVAEKSSARQPSQRKGHGASLQNWRDTARRGQKNHLVAFPPGRFHPLQHAGLSRRSRVCRLCSSWQAASNNGRRGSVRELPYAGLGKATHGSFHTTTSALEALLERERFRPAMAHAAQSQGREFLLTLPATAALRHSHGHFDRG
jgi:hypothetical protein